MKILVTGSAGFIGGYLVDELLKQGCTVVGIDNFSKYGKKQKKYANANYELVKGDVKNTRLLKKLLAGCDHLIAGAAMIGGIGYFHKYAYDLLAENERIIASTFDAAIDAFKNDRLKKITVISSSMVYESTLVFPTPESSLGKTPAPLSTYGFQKLAAEYFCRGAWEQYRLPYTIVRPFNCVGVGEGKMGHVVPDMVSKILAGQDPVHILGKGNQIRCYTYGGDIARGIVAAVFSPKAANGDFNISTAEVTTVLQLVKLIWKKINGNKPFHFVSDKPFIHDVQKRIPDVRKAKKILGFEAEMKLNEMLDEVIDWMKKNQ